MTTTPRIEVSHPASLHDGDLVWMPSAEDIARSSITHYVDWLSGRGVTGLGSYQDLWNWSVEDINRFWLSIFEFEDVISDEPPALAIGSDAIEGAEWFPGTRLNFAEQVFRDRDPDAVALICVSETSSYDVTWADLTHRVARLAETLRGFGVGPGDRVVGYLPNAEAAVVGFLAAASIGAIWSVCAPDLGVDGVVNRIGPLEPAVLIAVDGYTYGGKIFDRRDQVMAVVAKIPSIRHVVWVDSLGLDKPPCDGSTISWRDATSGTAPLSFVRLPFSAPLWVLFSSGTTGSPKGIVHGHGGTLLEQLKNHHLQFDERPGDRFLYVGSTSWMVWNLMVSALVMGTAVVLVDGNPIFPNVLRPFEIAAEHHVTQLGIGAGLVHAALKQDLAPNELLDLSSLRNVSITGSPLSVMGFAWLRDSLPDHTWMSTASGGTDICSAFVGSSPTVPTLAGRFQSIALGVALESWDADGNPHFGTKGELVVRKPMPSMPLYFLGDEGNLRLHESYFSTYPGVWRHGDFITIYEDGSSTIHGRSDATLNRNGVRMGPADISAVAEQLADVSETLVIGVERSEEYAILMFVRTVNGAGTPQLASDLTEAIRLQLSPRHVPDEIIFVHGIPHTKTGKKLEVPVKRLFQGEPVPQVIDLSAVDSVDAILEFERLAQQWIGNPHRASGEQAASSRS